MTDKKENQQNKVLIIGLDGATLDLIKPWVDKGKLPTFKHLMERGAWSELEVELPPGTVPNWPSFATGKNPGKHGLIWWVKPDPEKNDYKLISSADLRGKTIWDIAGNEGLDVGVVNVPVTYPPHSVNGFMITGLLTPPNSNKITYPDGLKDELQKVLGEYKVFPKVTPKKGNEKSYLDDLHDTLETRFKTVEYLLKNKPWDLFCVVFGATDWVMHAFWKHHDPKHIHHDPAEGKLYGHAILSIYEHIDRVLKSILELIDENTTVIIMSDHGAGPGFGKSMLNNWLLDIGLLRIKRTLMSQTKLLMWRMGFTIENVFPLVSKLGILRFKKRLDPRKTGKKNLVRRVFLSYNDVDWKNTKAFTVGGMGQVYINLRGRNPDGCVEPGEEYSQICDYIAKRITEIKLPNSEKSFVEKVFRRDELFHGEFNDIMPDIILLPSDMRYLDSGVEFASNKMFMTIDAVSGAHRRNGIFFLYGGETKSGAILENVNIRDVAPTTLHLLGLSIPDDMDGRVITEALNETFLKENPIVFSSTDDKDDDKSAGGTHSEEDEAIIHQRLANLGYMD